MLNELYLVSSRIMNQPLLILLPEWAGSGRSPLGRTLKSGESSENFSKPDSTLNWRAHFTLNKQRLVMISCGVFWTAQKITSLICASKFIHR